MNKYLAIIFLILIASYGFGIRDMYVTQPESLVGKSVKIIFDTKNSLKFSKNISITLNSDISSPMGSGDVSFVPQMSVKESGTTKRQLSYESTIDSKGFLNALIIGYSDGLLAIYGSYTLQIDGIGQSIEIKGLVNPSDVQGNLVKFENIINPSIIISKTSQQNITNVNLIPMTLPDGRTTIKVDIPLEEQRKIILHILNRIMSSF
jgi:hypothetical protein